MDQNLCMLVAAVKGHTPVSFNYNEFIREVCPHMIGMTTKNEIIAHCYQYGGSTSDGIVVEGQWKFFYLNKISGSVILKKGDWVPVKLTKSDLEYIAPKFISVVMAVS